MTLIHEVRTSHKAIAFTFDDGPNPDYTPQVLEIFREVAGRATFYMIGEHIEKYPETMRAVIAEQHEIGNHTYSHPKLSELGTEERKSELERTEKLIADATQRKTATFRPPYLDYNDDIADMVKSYGYKTIGAVNMESRDWEQPGVDHIVETSRSVIGNGSILLYHDGFGDRSQTIEALRILVKELAAEGYRLVTVSELLALEDQ